MNGGERSDLPPRDVRPPRVTHTELYRVNGVEYRSLDEMPPDVRRTVESLLPQDRPHGVGSPEITMGVPTRYVVNGVEYASLADVPAEHRALFEDRDGNGRPDIVDRALAEGGVAADRVEVVRERRQVLRSDDVPILTAGGRGGARLPPQTIPRISDTGLRVVSRVGCGLLAAVLLLFIALMAIRFAQAIR